MALSFRPHHFLCALCFQGKGYSPEFIKNFSALMERLCAPDGDTVMIHVTEHTDSICSPCPHREALLCREQEKIMLLDRAHADILCIQPGEKISWGEAKERIRTHMTLEKFHTACAPCEWKKYGICEKTLRKERFLS